MEANPFANFTVSIPNKYRKSVLKLVRSSGEGSSSDYSPFKRQIDFWYTAFLLGVHRDLEGVPDSDTYSITPGTIFSNEQFRISHMYLVYLGNNGILEDLANPRNVFDYCSEIAYEAMPELIRLLSDPDEKPLWSLLDEFEDMLSE